MIQRCIQRDQGYLRRCRKQSIVGDDVIAGGVAKIFMSRRSVQREIGNSILLMIGDEGARSGFSPPAGPGHPALIIRPNFSILLPQIIFKNVFLPQQSISLKFDIFFCLNFNFLFSFYKYFTMVNCQITVTMCRGLASMHSVLLSVSCVFYIYKQKWMSAARLLLSQQALDYLDHENTHTHYRYSHSILIYLFFLF